MLQPATKALAQVLAGQAKPSGQIVHARNVLAQAERLVAEGAVERLPPAQREEFHEQFARLKLTVTDYESQFETGAALPAGGLPEDVEEAEREVVEAPRPQLSAEKLRALALALAASTRKPAPEPSAVPAEAAPSGPTPVATATQEAAPEESPAATHDGRARLRLRPRGEADDAA